MASISDYVGKSFGDFEIKENISHGAENEIYTCLHKTTGRFYILRLGVNLDNLWDNQPQLPPVNYMCEFADEKQIQYGQISAERTYKWTMEKYLKDKTAVKMHEVDRYGVLDNRYLVPVDAVVTTKHSWDVDWLLQKAPADDLFLFELWEDIALSMMGEAQLIGTSSMKEKDWINKWGSLSGGTILKAAVSQYLPSGQLTRKEKDDVLARISEKHVDGPELAENLLIRLAGCLSRRRMTANEAMGTLLCYRFRMNVTWHELKQFVDVYNILRSEIMPSSSLKLLEFMIGPLAQQPFDIYENHEAIICRQKDTKYGEYKTILQEYAGTQQKYPSLAITQN